MHDPLFGREPLDVLITLQRSFTHGRNEAALFTGVIFPIALSPPEGRMEPEKGEREDQQAGHEDKGPVEGGIPLLVPKIGMRLVFHESRMEPMMTAPAVLDEIAGMDAGTGVRFRQDVMGPVTVGAPGHQGGLSDTADLAMVGLFIKLDGVFGNAVSPHHGFVGVAMVALLGIEGSRLDGIFLQGGVVNPCVVKAMAIAAVRSIPIPLENGLRMS